MSPKVPTMASGRATLVITVAHSVRRNRKMTMTTSPTVSMQRELHVLDGGADHLRAVAEHLDVDGRGNGVAQPRQQRLHPVGRLDDVGPGLALDVHDHRRIIVDPSGKVDVFHVVHHLADVLQPHRGTA